LVGSATLGRVIARVAIVIVALLGAGCPDEEEKSYPVLSDTGAGSLPTASASASASVPADAGQGDAAGGTGGPAGTGNESESSGTSGRDASSGDDTGRGTSDSGGPGATSLGEPPMVTTGILTSG
jgi:hypothetical protein